MEDEKMLLALGTVEANLPFRFWNRNKDRSPNEATYGERYICPGVKGPLKNVLP